MKINRTQHQTLIALANAIIWATIILIAAAYGAPKMMTTIALPSLALSIQFALQQKHSPKTCL